MQPDSSTRAGYPTLQAAMDATARRLGATLTNHWAYETIDGDHFATVARFDRANPGPDEKRKEYRPFVHLSDGWHSRDPDGLWPLFKVRDVMLAAESLPVYVVEGEKCCDALRELWVTATTSAHGSQSAKKSDWSPLKGRRVVILPDADEAGEKYAQDVARLAHEAGAAEVRIVRLPHLSDGQDVFDFIASWRAAKQEDGVILTAIEEAAEEKTQPIQFDSSTNTLSADESNPTANWIPVPLSEVAGSGAVDWLHEGYIAKGAKTLFSGLWKAGKSTFIWHVLRDMESGGEVGQSIAKGRALVVSEEPAAILIRRREELGIGDHVSVIRHPFRGRPTLAAWVAFMDHLAGLIRTEGYALIVFDTWATFSPCTDENDASEVGAAVLPLTALTEAGAAVLIVHHPPKTDVGEARASRGSGALPAAVDIIMELRRFAPESAEDRRRVLTAYGRFDETPKELVLELTDSGYRAVGTKAHATREDRQVVIGSILGDASQGLTITEVFQQWPTGSIPRPSRSILADDLRFGAECVPPRWARTGTGAKGKPYLYGGKCDSSGVGVYTDESNRNREEVRV